MHLRAALSLAFFLVASVALGAEQAKNANPKDALLNQPIEVAWEGVLEAAKKKDYNLLNAELSAINKWRIENGYAALEEYSLMLVGFGLKELSEGDLSAAGYFGRKALELAPASPRVLLKSLRLAPYIGSSTFGQLWRGFRATFRYAGATIELLATVLYPLLWAITLGLYAVCLLTIAFNSQWFLRSIAPLVPTWCRGLFAPILGMAFIVAPIFYGPLWCLVCWSLLILLAIPRHKVLGMGTGMLLILWSVAIPYSEALNSWLSDESTRSLLQISERTFVPEAEIVLANMASNRPDDGLAAYTQGQFFKRTGDNTAAKKSFERAKALVPGPWIEAQFGIVNLLEGDVKGAEERFNSASEQGLSSAEFLFNYSRVKFEGLDTASSREYFDQAKSRAPALVSELQELENTLGMKNPNSLAEINLPIYVVLGAAFKLTEGLENRYAPRVAAVMPGASLKLMAIVGGIILLWSMLIRRREHDAKFHPFYNRYKRPKILKRVFSLIPGGAWVYRGSPAMAWLILSVVALLLSPLASWPAESALIFVAMPGLALHYTYALVALLFALCVANFHFTFEEG